MEYAYSVCTATEEVTKLHNCVEYGGMGGKSKVNSVALN